MKRAFTLIEAVIVLAVILILVAVLLPVFIRAYNPDKPHRSGCISNLKQIGLGFAQYTQDYNEKFPLVSHGGAGGWSEDLQPYTKKWQLFQCPVTKNYSLKTSDYFYNSRLDGHKTGDLTSSVLTIAGGDGPDDAPLSSHLSALPADATTNESSFAQRHLGIGNYLFADGHVRGLKPEQIVPDLPITSSAPTFAIR